MTKILENNLKELNLVIGLLKNWCLFGIWDWVIEI